MLSLPRINSKCRSKAVGVAVLLELIKVLQFPFKIIQAFCYLKSVYGTVLAQSIHINLNDKFSDILYLSYCQQIP